MRLTSSDLSYFAGFFDGEGCITIAKTKPSFGRLRPRFALSVRVVQANEWIIQLFKFYFGGKVYLRPSIEYRQQWMWEVNNKKAVPFLRLILPYLKLKKSEAELAIEFQTNRLNSGYKGEGEMETQQVLEEAQRILLSNMKDKS